MERIQLAVDGCRRVPPTPTLTLLPPHAHPIAQLASSSELNLNSRLKHLGLRCKLSTYHCSGSLLPDACRRGPHWWNRDRTSLLKETL